MLTAKRRTALVLSLALGVLLGLGFISRTAAAPDRTMKVVQLRPGGQLIGVWAGIDEREIRVRFDENPGRYCIDGLGTVSWASIDNHLDRLLEQAREQAGRHHAGLCSR